MPHSTTAIEEFKAIYREDFGVVLADEDALTLATSFYGLMQAIYRPLPVTDCKQKEEVV